jgi:hypothetical protein
LGSLDQLEDAGQRRDNAKYSCSFQSGVERIYGSTVDSGADVSFLICSEVSLGNFESAAGRFPTPLPPLLDLTHKRGFSRAYGCGDNSDGDCPPV